MIVRHRRRTLRRRRLHPGLNDGRWCASGSLEATGRTPGRACASYEAQRARSNEIVAAASLDDVGRHPACRSGNADLRWVLIHLVEETGRHAGRAGHAGIMRELLDGAKGVLLGTVSRIMSGARW
ncbi:MULTISPECIES: DUF664 domain-containing protein [unclassified Streptomyces]|uniref:mycothiol transferase n=1 Tax=unclassified Streptomyces TaxID=2593676 RepID=UPI003818901C